MEFQFEHRDDHSVMKIKTAQHNEIKLFFINATHEFSEMWIDDIFAVDVRETELATGLFVSIGGQFVSLQQVIHAASIDFPGAFAEAEQDGEDYERDQKINGRQSNYV